jgi:hypothetical protein
MLPHFSIWTSNVGMRSNFCVMKMRLEARVRRGLKLLNSKIREGNRMLPGTDGNGR